MLQDVFLRSVGPAWVGSAAVFIALVVVPPGRAWLSTRLECGDPTSGRPVAAAILENEVFFSRSAVIRGVLH